MPLKPYVRRYEDLKILYDLDFPARSRLLRQRVYKSEDGTIQTPVTALLLARQVPTDCPVPVARDFDPRHLVACFENPSNVTGESNLKAISPYRPTDALLQAHLREILSYPGVLSGRYQGETHSRSVSPFLN